jgi:hypothetical protein
MNATEKRHPSHSFVLRIWWEEAHAQPVWRGWVQHATTGETCCFECLGDLLTFVETHTGLLVQASGPESGASGTTV